MCFQESMNPLKYQAKYHVWLILGRGSITSIGVKGDLSPKKMSKIAWTNLTFQMKEMGIQQNQVTYLK